MLPHEETMPAHVASLAEEIRRDGIQRDPIIVDSESGAVLDGMHRLAAFSKLGVENAVCSPVDYSSRRVELRRWARTYSRTGGADIGRTLSAAGLSEPCTFAEAFGGLEDRSSCLALFYREKGYRLAGRQGLKEAFAVMRAADSAAAGMGWKREFVSEDEVDSAIQDSAKAVLLVQRLTKGDVVDAARRSELFPCKTSMHVIDPRPVAVNVRIEELASLTGRELRLRVERSASARVLPEGSLYHGRRYKERLLVVNPE